MEDPVAKLGSTRSMPQIGSVLGLLRKRKWLILGLTVCAGIATGFVVSKQPPIYETGASIVIELSVPQYLGSGFRDVVEVEPSWWHSRETLETEFRTLRSLSQATYLAKALCDREFNGGPALKKLLPDTKCIDAADYGRAAPMLQGMVRIVPQKESRIVEMIARSTDPQFAALLANTAVQVYADRNLERRLAHSAGAATWLGEEYNQLMAELRSAEQKLGNFKEKHNIVTVSLEDDQNEISTRRRRLSDELSAVEVKLIALRAEREALNAPGAKGDPVNDLNPALIRSPVAQKLKELYIEEYGKLVGLQGKYLEKHPSILAQEQRVSVIKEDIRRESELARRAFESQYQAMSKQAQDLRAALEQATKQLIAVEAKTAEYFSLKRDLDRLIKLSEQVGGRGRETSLASNLKTNNVRILDRAEVPRAPVAPNVPRAVSIAVAAALLLSIGLALLLDALDNTVKTQDDVEQFVGLTFLGIVPRMESDERAGRLVPNKEGEGEGRDLFVFHNPKSQAAECCRAIRTNLLFMSPDRPARTMLITSAGPQEGKTTVAVSMAITMAQSGLRVLIVDTDMRRPRLHRALGIPSSVEGLSSAILGKAGVLTFVRATAVPNLWVLPCGASPPNPAELIHADRFHQIVHEVSAEFDRVIFDSPPLGAVTDASILARLTDATMMVAKAGRTSKYALLRARRQIAGDARVNLLGCVLNDLSLSNQREYGYYPYYYSRYGYYGPSEGAEGAGKA